MNFGLIDSGWNEHFSAAVSKGHPELRIVCPFIKESVAERLLKGGHAKAIQVITRFNLADFSSGVSDTAALRLLLSHGAQIRGVRGLHAKVYLFGDSQVIVTSANLTEAALSRNHEFGFTAEDSAINLRCRSYFDDLWQRAGPDLVPDRIDQWEKRLKQVNAAGARPKAIVGLPDEGVNLTGAPSPFVEPDSSEEDIPLSFVKFFGLSTERMERTRSVLDQVDAAGCHWACTYSEIKRPSKDAVHDGDVAFMAWLVKDPDDILIFGRAIALQHVPGRDDATLDDRVKRPMKENWPCYIRVHHAEFVAGSLENGVSLYRLMEELKVDSFASTQDNAADGEGNINPRKSVRQQPAVRLSKEGYRWLNQKLDTAFRTHGKVTPDELEKLDWPTIPGSPTT